MYTLPKIYKPLRKLNKENEPAVHKKRNMVVIREIVRSFHERKVL